MADSSYSDSYDGNRRNIADRSMSPVPVIRQLQIHDNSMMTSERGRARERSQMSERRPVAISGVRGSVSASRARSKSPAATRTAHGVGEEKLTNSQAFIHMIKASLGTGVLSLPSAVMNAGLLFGTVGVFIVCWIVIHAMHLLIEVAQYVREYFDLTDEEDVDLDYAETFDRTLQLGSIEILQRLRWMKHLLNTFLIISQIGFLGVYVVFVAENIENFVSYFLESHPDLYHPPLILYKVILTLCFIPLIMVKTLEKLSVLSIIANITGFLSLGIILVCCFTQLRPASNFPLIKSIDTLPLFFGTVVFSFESINLVLPIESKMKDQKAFGGAFGVLTLSVVFVVAFDVAIAFYGYLRFGETVAGSITYSLPTDEWYYLMVRPLYSVSIFITYALQFYIVFVIIWEKIENRLYTPRMMFWGDLILRLSILLVSFLLAAVVPHIELMISLVGALSGSAIALMFPPFLHSIVVYSDKRNRPFWMLTIFKNILIIIFGLFGAIVGTGVSIKKVVELFGEGK